MNTSSRLPFNTLTRYQRLVDAGISDEEARRRVYRLVDGIRERRSRVAVAESGVVIPDSLIATLGAIEQKIDRQMENMDNKLDRRFDAIWGTMEITDSKFDRLAAELDQSIDDMRRGVIRAIIITNFIQFAMVAGAFIVLLAR